MVRLVLALLILVNPGCASTHNSPDTPLRERLVLAVQEARDEQKLAKTGFSSALGEFLSVTRIRVPELEERYTSLNSRYLECAASATAVHNRIATLERVAEALFKEWELEIAQYSSNDLRQTSKNLMQTTGKRAAALIESMKSAESKMRSVLASFNDQVLILKHNLNARALEAMKGNADQIEAQTTELIREMEKAIAEANAFVQQL